MFVSFEVNRGGMYKVKIRRLETEYLLNIPPSDSRAGCRIMPSQVMICLSPAAFDMR